MSVRLVDIEERHLALIRPQHAQAEEYALQPGMPNGTGWTALVGEHPVCIGGLTLLWPNRAYAWAVLGEDAGPHMLSLTRAIRSRLDAAPFARIEMVVERGFHAAARWAEMLGYQLETPEPLRRFLPNGRDAWIYSRIK